jgi:hypothetical protein
VACATPLSASHTARVLAPGQLEVSLGTGMNLPAGAYLRLAGPVASEINSIVQQIRRKQQVVFHPDKDLYIGVGAALTLANLPAQVTEIAVRYGVLRRLDVGLRYSGDVWRGEVFGQVYNGATWKIAAGVGVAHRSFDHGLAGVLKDFDLLSVSQTDLDWTLLAGRDWTYGAVYFGPKVVFSKYTAQGSLMGSNEVHINVLGNQLDSSLPLGLDLRQSWLTGVVIGGRAGYKHIYVTAEIDVYQAFYNPILFSQQAKLSGLVLYPTVGLAAPF